MSPNVSVIIRAHARPNALRAAIESVLAQTYRDFEIVVSDDAGHAQVVARGFGDARVRYHRNPAPAGPAGNLVHGISVSRGQILAILNDDDLWLPDFLVRTVEILDRDPDIGIAFTNDLYEVGATRFARDLPFRPGRHDRFLRALLEHAMPASAAVIRRTVWADGERMIPLSPEMVGDAFVWPRAAAAGSPFYYLPEPLAVSRLHRSQVSWSDQGLPSRMIATHEAFRFDDPACEDLRRARLAEFFLARAGAHMTHRRFGAARADIESARREAQRPIGLRGLFALSGLRGPVMRWGSEHPGLLVPLLKLWRRLRPPVLRTAGRTAT